MQHDNKFAFTAESHPDPRKGCRFVLGDPARHGWAYCGARRKAGSAFCESHHTLCHRPPNAFERALLKGLTRRRRPNR